MLEDYFFTKNTKWVLWGAFAVIVALLIFHAGEVVGSHQPMRRGPGQPAPGMLGGIMPNEAFIGDHGAVGSVENLALPTFDLNTRDGGTQKVYVSTSTAITGPQNGTAMLQNGELVVVIGDPRDSDGYLDARVIHILR